MGGRHHLAVAYGIIRILEALTGGVVGGGEAIEVIVGVGDGARRGHIAATAGDGDVVGARQRVRPAIPGGGENYRVDTGGRVDVGRVLQCIGRAICGLPGASLWPRSPQKSPQSTSNCLD